jgi:hypothetical protein
MRLVQLSRKLALKPSDIQGFLAGIYTGTEIGQNTRLTDEQVLRVVRHFDPSKEATILNEAPAPEPPEPAAEVSMVQDEQQAETEQEASLPVVEQLDNSVEETAIETTPEVIRVPKQELPGLRVVGKIELKEPKKKDSTEAPTEGSEPKADRSERQERPVRPVRREQPQQRVWRNPLETQRQREIEEREERRRQQLEQEKARKTQKYLKKVKSAPTKPVRRQEETVVETQVDAKPAPKTWIGKFKRWLTT